MCKGKIHRATVTDANLNYQGSLTVDCDLLERADILPYEQVQVVNVNNGSRFETYLIEGERGSGVLCLNGPCARLAQVGDVVILITYADMSCVEADTWEPTVVHVDRENHLTEIEPETAFTTRR